MKINYYAILFALLSIVYSKNTYSQTQIGNDIDGEASSDLLGSATAISDEGSIVAVGVERNDGNGTDSGQVKVYNNINNDWVQLGSTLYGNEGDYFGSSISLSSDGTILAVAASRSNSHVKVFKYNGTDWEQLGDDFMRASNDGFNTMIGLSLSSDGNKIAIGKPLNDEMGSNTGQVRIYEYANNQWTQVGQNINGKPSDSLLDERFGYSVSLSDDGSRVGVGAPGSGLALGKARVYEFDGTDWSQIGLDFGPGNQGSAGGSTVSLSANGNRIAVSAPGIELGAAFIYDDNGTQWVNTEIFDITGKSKVSLSADGRRLAISDFAYNWTGDGFFDGFYGNVRIYDYDLINQEWPLLGSEIVGVNSWDEFGSSVALSGDGTTVIAGAAFNDDNGLSNQGHARVFDLESNTLHIAKNDLDRNFSIYPNPSSINKIYVVAKPGIKIQKVVLYLIDGKKVIEIIEPTAELNLQQFPKGVYLVNIQSDSATVTKKIILN